MNFKELMQSDLDAIFTADEFDQEITVAGVAVRALVGVPDASEEQYPAVSGVSISVEVRKSELPAVVRGAAVVVDGVSYRVVGEPMGDAFVWNLFLELDKRSVSL